MIFLYLFGMFSLALLSLAFSFFVGEFLSGFLYESIFSEWIYFSSEHHELLRLSYSLVFACGVITFLIVFFGEQLWRDNKKDNLIGMIESHLDAQKSIKQSLSSIDHRVGRLEEISHYRD